jgi:hypothetical protein
MAKNSQVSLVLTNVKLNLNFKACYTETIERFAINVDEDGISSLPSTQASINTLQSFKHTTQPIPILYRCTLSIIGHCARVQFHCSSYTIGLAGSSRLRTSSGRSPILLVRIYPHSMLSHHQFPCTGFYLLLRSLGWDIVQQRTFPLADAKARMCSIRISGEDAGGFLGHFAALDFPDAVVSGHSIFWIVPPLPTDLERYAAG